MSSPAQPPLLSNVHSSHTYFPFNVSSKTLLTRVSILVIAALLISGCSDSPSASEPTTPLQPSASATAEPSPTPTTETSEPNDTVSEPVELEPPILPDAAQSSDAKGAFSFAQHFLATLNYTALSGDTKPLKEISGENCSYCERFAAMTDDEFSDGYEIENYSVAFTKDPVLFRFDDGFAAMETSAYRTPYIKTKGNQVEQVPEETQIGVFAAGWVQGKWVVYGYGPEAKE